MKIGTNDISKIYLGGVEVSNIYLGTSQVYEGGDTPTPPAPVPYSGQYLTFVAEADNCTIGLTYAHNNVFQYSVDSGTTWSNIANNERTTSVNSGQTIMFKASGLTVTNIDGIGVFDISGTNTFSVQGNVMSLVYGDDFIGQTTMQEHQFASLLWNCSGLTSAENLILPATTLTKYCYISMFTNCINLTVAPELTATTLADDCYMGMFKGCTSLTTAPALSATTLAALCYANMFSGCTSLTAAPELSATILAKYCYQSMFQGCTNLNYIKCLATDISATGCTKNWVDGVSATGTFVKAASMSSWSTGVDGIPNNWTVLNDGEEPPHDYSQDYLTTESTRDNNTISFTMGTGMTTAITTAVTSVSVSTDDGVTWTSMENIGANASLSVTLDTGEKAIWKGEAIGYSTATAATRSTLFSSTGTYKVYGNITSLLYDDNFKNQNNPTLPDFNCFANLFYGSTGLTDASNLIMHFEMPATTSKRQIGYLFQGCTSLTAAPELKNIGFGGSQYTFRNMFQNCTSLTVAPELTATTLVTGCYAYMFQDCTSLNSITCLATSISASNCTTKWVDGVSATGTFVKAASMSSWSTGTNGIPDGWDVWDAV